MHHKNSDIMQSITMDQSPIPDVTMESDQNNNNENSSNNNLSMKKNEKYSLRQRGQRKSISSKFVKSSAATAGSYDDKVNNSNAAAVAVACVDNEQKNSKSSRVKKDVPKEKPKQRAAPLSKYRRKTANARERTRMREINHAFETLRHSVPVVIAGSQSQNTNEKLTKITTLRMAMKYIKILNDIIEDKAEVSECLLAALMDVDSQEKTNDMFMAPVSSPSPSQSSSSSSSSYLTFSNVTNSKKSKKSSKKEKLKKNNCGNVLAQNHHDYCKEIIRESNVKPVKQPAKATAKKSVKATSNNTSKTKKSPKKSNINKNNNNNNNNNVAKASSRNSNKNHQQLFTPPTRRQIQRTTKLENKFVNHLLGGSFNQTMLHNTNLNNNNSMNCLSKYDLSPCLTPPNDDSPADLGLILESDGESLQLSEPCFSPLELGLLLESDGESLHLSEPCLSPLNNLDALNSFDLLHSGFSEHNSLEMYLS